MLGRAAGAVTDDRWSAFERTFAEIEDATKLLKDVSLSPQVCLPKVVYGRLYTLSTGLEFTWFQCPT